jgi:hypothetical protein
VSHDCIERTLLPFLSELEKALEVDELGIREQTVQYWQEHVKPHVVAVVEEAQTVLSPRLLLASLPWEEAALVRFEAAAYEVLLPGGDSLVTRLVAAKHAALTADAALGALRETASGGVVHAAQRAVSDLRRALRALPTSPVIP